MKAARTFFDHPGICYRRPPGGRRQGGGGGGEAAALHWQIDLIQSLVRGPRANMTEAAVLERHQALSVVLPESPYLFRAMSRAVLGLLDLHKIFSTPAITTSLISVFKQCASLALDNSDFLGVASFYNNAAGLSGEASDYMLAGEHFGLGNRPKEAGHAFRKAVDLSTGDDVRINLIRTGEEFERAELYAAAGAAFLNAHQISPDVNLLLRAAQNFGEQDGYIEAGARCVEDAARLSSPEDAITLWRLAADTRRDMGQYKEAGFAYGEAAKLADGNLANDLWISAGECFLEAGLRKEALHVFSQVPIHRRPRDFGLLAGKVSTGMPCSAAKILEDEGDACEDRDEARRLYLRAARGYAERREHRKEGLATLKAAQLTSGAGRANFLYEAARKLIMGKAYTAVLDALEQVTREEGNPNLWKRTRSLLKRFERQLQKPEDRERAKALRRWFNKRLQP